MHDFDQIYLRNPKYFLEKSFIFLSEICTILHTPLCPRFYQFPIFRKQIDFFCKCLQFLLHILFKSVRHRYRLASSSKSKALLRSGQTANEIWMRIYITSTRFRSDFFKKSKRFLSKYFNFSFKNMVAKLQKFVKLAHITGVLLNLTDFCKIS